MNWMINRKMVTGAFAATVAACGFVDAKVPYVNNFAERTSETIPSDRWMETTYKTGSLARRLAASAITEYSPYANERDYQDGWAAKKIWNNSTGNIGFSVVSDNGNQVVMANGVSESYDTSDTAVIQPFGNEFKDGVLKISVDIRTPPQSDSFISDNRAYALFAPIYKSELDVTSDGVGMPLYFGPANLDNDGYKLRAVSRGRKSASGGDSFIGQYDVRNDITAGNWVRYEAILNLSAGTYTATFTDLSTNARNDFRQEQNSTASTTLHFVTAMTEETGGIAGLAFLVRGLKQADASVAPMFDNIFVSWQEPESGKFVSVYENNFTTRRYRSIEPDGTISGSYSLTKTTNIVNSVGYDFGSWTYTYNVNESNAGLLVPESGTAGVECEGWDGWHRRSGSAGFSLLNPNKDGGYGWKNGALLRVTKKNTHGVLAVPLGQTIRSGKVRLYFDLMPGRKSVMGNYTEAFAMCFLSGGGMGGAAFVNTTTKSTMWGGKAICGAGYYINGTAGSEYNPGNIAYGAGNLKANYSPTTAAAMCRWHRYVVTADLDAKKYEFQVYQYGLVGQPMNYDISNIDAVAKKDFLNFMDGAPSEIDSLFIASQGHSNFDSWTTWDGNNNLGYAKFPCFDNIRVCRVNDDGSDGLEIYSCDFGGSTRRTECEAASLTAGSGREGADKWVTRGQTHYAVKVREVADGDQVMVVDGLNNVERYVVQPFGGKAKSCSIVDVVADIRPADAWANANGCMQVEIGGDDYYQGNQGWRSLPRVFFGFRETAGTKSVGLFKNVKFAAGTESSVTLSDVAVDPSHWYRFRAKANIKDGKFTVDVYDLGAEKPAASIEDGMLVAAITDVSMTLDRATTLGISAKGVVSRFGGGTDDPSVVMLDNLSVSITNPAFQIILR